MKAPDAFRTISEVAEDLELPQHVLRFWETRFTQIKPMKRGGGRRYYRPEDVDLLRGIRLLLYGEGFTIRGVQRLLKEKGVGFVVSVGRSGSLETMAAPDAETRPVGAAPEPSIGAPPRESTTREPPPLRVVAPDRDDDLDAGDDEETDDRAVDDERVDGEGEEGGATPRGELPDDDPASPFRPAPQPRQRIYALGPDKRRRLEGVLSELLEAKRLLEQTR